MEKTKKENCRGITLIALVITIIVLLLLAGVSIATLTGDNGILEKAQQAKEENKKAEEEEIWKLGDLDATIDEIVTGEIQARPVKDSDPGILKEIETNVFLIESIEDLVEFSKFTNGKESKIQNMTDRTCAGKTIKLEQTLDFNSVQSYADEASLKPGVGLKDDLKENGFSPIAMNVNLENLEGAFFGTFDGNDCTLKNFKTKSKQMNGQYAGSGLFGVVAMTGKVSNLNVIGEAILNETSNQTSLSGLAAMNLGTIQDCKVNIKMSGTNSSTENSLLLGGVIGFNMGTGSGLISTCDISAESRVTVGGIAGINGGTNGGTIQNSKAQGKIVATNTNKSWEAVGGIVGENQGNGKVTQSESLANITVTDASNTGGIVGHNLATVMNCKAQVNLTATNTGKGMAVGGIAGSNEKDVINNINLSSINITNESDSEMVIGGIVGDNLKNLEISPNKQIINCYSNGNINLTRNGTGNIKVGGIAGQIITSSNISNCYFTGNINKVSGDITAYHLVGYANGGGNVQNCIYKGLATAIDNNTPIGGSGFTKADLIFDNSLTEETVFEKLNEYVSGKPDLVPWK